MHAKTPPIPQAGDIWACYGSDGPSRFISWQTCRPWAPRRLRLGPSHVAMCVEKNITHPLWVESTTTCDRPCLIRGRRVSGCQAHEPEDRLRDYLVAGGEVDLYRLSEVDRLDSMEAMLLSCLVLNKFVQRGVDYDLGGALISGSHVVRRIRLRRVAADLSRVFCSELIAKMLMRLGRMNISNPAGFHPANLLRDLVRSGVYQFHHSYQLDGVADPPATIAYQRAA